MNQFIKEKTEYTIDKNAFQKELEKLTFLNVYTTYPYIPDSRGDIDCTRLEIYLDTHLCDSDGNEVKEFNYNLEIGYKEILENPNFVFDIIQKAEQTYREYYIDYCEDEIKFLQEKLEELKKR